MSATVGPGPRPRRNPKGSPWRYVVVAVMLFLVLALADVVLTNPNFGWPVVGQYLFSAVILEGLLLTLELTAVVMVVGCVLGVILAVMRTSTNTFVARGAWAYIWFFRGTPLLIQVIFWFNIAALFPRITLGVPFGPTLPGIDANALVTPWTAAVLALSLNEAAYMAEIVRGGLLGVDRGQYEAAQALGMRPIKVFGIILPQAVRTIIPPTANQLVTTFKNTALVSVIGLADLLHSAQVVYALNYQTIPLLIVAAFWYLLLTSLLSYFQSLLERRYSKGYVPRSRPQSATGTSDAVALKEA
ncbi:amino acid ABC transporter permease [Microtetraspora niveoalba]|uniref:amino acid ABC transporter permease n=1 Tax=Microtetraspora niveoalba TaxID=46175 RepID=UPI000AF26054|nr:amino acid ABC transporter permease [Microtetraspora niveoalba]